MRHRLQRWMMRLTPDSRGNSFITQPACVNW
jgi:hypothetical protein